MEASRPAMYASAVLFAISTAAMAQTSPAHDGATKRFAQATTAPASPAEQRNALGTANQASGKIKSIDQSARTITLDNNQVFTVGRQIDITSYRTGDAVLITFEPDTTTATAVEKAKVP